jgi:hypothetical protein
MFVRKKWQSNNFCPIVASFIDKFIVRLLVVPETIQQKERTPASTHSAMDWENANEEFKKCVFVLDRYCRTDGRSRKIVGKPNTGFVYYDCVDKIKGNFQVSEIA